MFRLPPRGRLKVVAVVSVRLLNTPATLGNLGGWFGLRDDRKFMSDTAVFAVILVIVVIVLLVKLSNLRGDLDSRANELARSQFDRWKSSELTRIVAREVELSIAAVRDQAKNDIQLAQQQARLDLQQWKKAEEIRIRQDAITRSEATHKGNISEHLAPLLLDDIFDPRDIRFIGSPIDLIVFHGLAAGYVEAIHFIEIKSGRSAKLAPREELVRGAAAAGRVAYNIVHLTDNRNNDRIDLNWLSGKPAPQHSNIMNEELRILMAKRREACLSIDVDSWAELDTKIYENFGRSIAKLADELAVLRFEVQSTKDREKQVKKSS